MTCSLEISLLLADEGDFEEEDFATLILLLTYRVPKYPAETAEASTAKLSKNMAVKYDNRARLMELEIELV